VSGQAPGYAIAALALLWLAVAIGLSVLAARRLRLAQDVLGAARANAALLELTPARPLLVRADGRIECDPQLLRDLGLGGQPAHLADLAGNGSGIERDDLEALTVDVDAARASAGRVARKVKADGSGRVFEVRGAPAPAPEAAGTMLLWFFDTSASEEDRARIAL
jgi:hypothetical protein